MKNSLSKRLRGLSPNSLRGCLKVMTDLQPNNGKVVEFDINKLSALQCSKLDEYVNECIARKSQPQQ